MILVPLVQRGHSILIPAFVLGLLLSCGRAPLASAPTGTSGVTTPVTRGATSPDALAPRPIAAPTTPSRPTPLRASSPEARAGGPQPLPVATPPPAGSAVLPFGPFHLPEAEFGSTFTGAFRTLRPNSLVPVLEAARRARIRLIIHLVGGRRRYQEANGAFSVARFRQRLDVYGRVDLAPYVADGTIVGHLLFDEPHDPSNWNGAPVPYRDIEAAAAYSKQLWPTMPVGVAGPPSYLQGGTPWSALDFAFAQYSSRRGDVVTWLRREVDLAQRSGLGLVLSTNVLHGNDRSPVTPTQLREWATALVSEPSACAVLMWKYDERGGGAYFRDPAIADVVTALARMAKERRAAPCRR